MGRTDELKSTFKYAFPKTLPVLAGYLVLGFGFGLLLQSKGYNFIWAIGMSIVIYGGSMQYVGVDLLASGAGLISAAIMSFMIQARHIFYGIALLTKYRGAGKTKPYVIFATTDETFSLVSSTEIPDEYDKNTFYFIVSILNQMYWIIGGALGALFGQMVHINTKGVDFSMTSMFVVIFVDNLIKQERRTTALIGAAVSILCLIILGPDDFLIPAMLLISLVLMLLRPLLDKEGVKNE